VRGNPGDPNRDRFIRGLHAIFVLAGDRGRVSNNAGKISGPFFDFVSYALRLAGANTSEAGVHNAIGKALS
jgi:hypothetical protein